MPNRKRTMTKKFYVGNEQFAAQLLRNGNSPNYLTLEEAIMKAEKRLMTRPEMEGLVIVQVVKVITRKPPIQPDYIIEDVR